MLVRVFFVAVGVKVLEAQCPGGGLSINGRCWYLGEAGQSCSIVCNAKGLAFNWQVPPESDPVVPKLLGRQPATRQFSWGRLECYVPSADRYHTAKTVADSNSGDRGDPGDWIVDVCRLSCPCGQYVASLDSTEVYPACVQKNIVLRHAGAHAIFVDVSIVGTAGCWQNDCKHTDKFEVASMGACARICAKLLECTHWSFGEQGGTNKCFLRKSDGGRENAQGWYAAAKQCAPPPLPDAWMALKASELLHACDSGRSNACPDMARAITTWKFAIRHLRQAIVGTVLDGSTRQYLDEVGADTDTFAEQINEENFHLIVDNNRQVFNIVTGWMKDQPQGIADPSDMSLPNPLRGLFCGPNTCYDQI